MLTPGVAMCAPTRYTTRHRSVKRIFSFSSGTLNRLGSRGAVIRSARDRAARLLDLRAGGGRHRHTLDAELALDIPHAEQLERAVVVVTGGRRRSRGGAGLCPQSGLGLRLQFRQLVHARLRVRHRLVPCLRRRHGDEVTFLVEYTAESGMVRLDHAVLMVLES